MKHLRKDYDRIQDPAIADPSLLAPGCKPIAEDEPVFLLRAQDGAAAHAVLAWADEAERLGADANLVGAVRAWAARMISWRSSNVGWQGKIPDTPDGQLKL